MGVWSNANDCFKQTLQSGCNINININIKLRSDSTSFSLSLLRNSELKITFLCLMNYHTVMVYEEVEV